MSDQKRDTGQRDEGYSFGGQRPYARDLYSDSPRSRHETDWTSGNAGREMRNVYSRPSNSSDQRQPRRARSTRQRPR